MKYNMGTKFFLYPWYYNFSVEDWIEWKILICSFALLYGKWNYPFIVNLQLKKEDKIIKRNLLDLRWDSLEALQWTPCFQCQGRLSTQLQECVFVESLYKRKQYQKVWNKKWNTKLWLVTKVRLEKITCHSRNWLVIFGTTNFQSLSLIFKNK